MPPTAEAFLLYRPVSAKTVKQKILTYIVPFFCHYASKKSGCFPSAKREALFIREKIWYTTF